MIRINQPFIEDEEIEIASEVLSSKILTSWHGGGKYVAEFERAFASYIDVKHAIAVNSGTAALHTALVAAGIGPGDEVIVPAMTFVATANVVAITGAKPIFVDVDPETLCIDPEKVQEAITSKTKAIIPVHVYGQPANMKAIMEIAEDKGIIVIEDAAQAHGAIYMERKVGSIGHIGCFSFFATKNMTTGGEGGIVTTNDAEIARRCRLFRTHGQEEAYKVVMLGLNYRMTELAAAIGILQLKKLDRMNAIRAMNANLLDSLLHNVKGIRLPPKVPGTKPSYYVYTIRLEEQIRNSLKEYLLKNGIEATIYWPKPVHLQPFYMDLLGTKPGMLPISEEACKEVLSIPVHQGLTSNDIKYIAEKIKEFLKL